MCLAHAGQNETLHPNFLIDAIGWEGIRDWRRYFYRNPYGFEILNYQVAKVVAAVKNVLVTEERNIVDPHECMVEFRMVDLEFEQVPEETLSDEELLDRFKAAHAARMGKPYEKKSDQQDVM